MNSLALLYTTLPQPKSRPFDTLPPELVCRILYLLGPRDVVRLRLVAKLFHGVSYDPEVWRMIYANATLPRPPGPFPSQSARFLERILIRSERLARYWTTQPTQAISGTQIRLGGLPLGRPRIVGGRWLVTIESYKHLVFYDVEAHLRLAVWEDTTLITSWDACTVTFGGCVLVYVIVRKSTNGAWDAPWKLLEFQAHSESGQLSFTVSLDVPAKYLGQSVLVGDKTPFLYIMGQYLVFDTRTRVFYEFPSFVSELYDGRADLLFMTSRKVLLTNTHIIVIFHRSEEHSPSSRPESTLIQIFTLPTDHRHGDGTGTLRLSHEGVVAGFLASLVVIRNSTVDPTTGATSLKLLRLEPKANHLHFTCVNVTLSKSNSDTVLPAFIDDVRDTFTIERGISDPFMSACGYYIEASDDGHARGFCKIRGDDWLDTPCITKFTLDASGDGCVAVVGRALAPRWINDEDPPCFSMLSFDGVIGRFCHIKGNHNWRLRGFVDAVVVDIK